MWRVSLRDLQWRRRRFAIAVVATALVFSMTLLMAGTSAALRTQTRRIVASFHADRWYVAEGAAGPFTTTTPIPAAAATAVGHLAGVVRATPVVLLRSTVDDGTKTDVNVIAVPPGGLGAPSIAQGRAPAAVGELAADTALGLHPGDSVNLGGRPMRVVGTARDATYFFGTPTIYLTLADAQALFFGGLPLVSAVAAEGHPQHDPAHLTALTPAEVREDLTRPTESGEQTIQFINVLLWIVAAGIIGSIVYLSSLERSRDFAVMKATGASDRSLLLGLAIQAVSLSAASALAAAVIARLLTPGFPFEVVITARTYVLLTLVAVVIGLVASTAGLRRAVRVDPALAFGGS